MNSRARRAVARALERRKLREQRRQQEAARRTERFFAKIKNQK